MFLSSRFRLVDLTFYSGLLLVVLCFFWSRINGSDHLYFVGDGTAIVALIEEMLRSGDWTADGGRIVSTLQVQEEWQPYAEDALQPGGHYFNLSGYVVVATAFCRTLQVLGFDTLTIPFMLHGLNVFLQSMTLLLLFLMGRHITGRNMGLLAMLFFTALPLAVTEAHYERPESWLAFLSAVMLYSLMKYPQAPKSSALVMGSALGFSVAVKASQLFLGIIPFALVTYLFFQSTRESWRNQGGVILSCSIIMAAAMLAAITINIPFIFSHLPDYLYEISITSSFFDKPHPLYATEHYSYISQLLYILNYFLSTLGIGWSLVLLTGFCISLLSPVSRLQILPYYRSALVIPPIFLLFFFSSKYNFMDRIFSSTEPMLCMLSAIGVHFVFRPLEKIFKHKALFISLILFVLSIILYKPVALNYKFIQHHIRQPGYQPRIQFQDALKKDFRGFWIKNVHATVGYAGAIPKKPEKPPRIYHLEDYNQYWTIPHLEILKKNGFIHIGTYCSDFYDLPASNFTIYHAAAKNHYLVLQNEWPGNMAPGYFKTNCL